MLRVHNCRLARRDPKEGGVEVLDVSQVSSRKRDRVLRCIRSTLDGQVANYAASGPEQLPKLVRVVRLGKAATKADNRDRALLCCRGQARGLRQGALLRQALR